MVINVHAWHNPDGRIACGAIGLLKESTQARNVKNEVKSQIQRTGLKLLQYHLGIIILISIMKQMLFLRVLY